MNNQEVPYLLKMAEGVAIFLVHFNGTLDEQVDHHAYIGGKTRLLTLPYTSGFDELIYTIHDRIGTMPNEARLGVKCQVPIGKFLKREIIIDIEDDKDFKAVLEMFKNSTISLGMLYITKFKPIEDTQLTSTSMPRKKAGAINESGAKQLKQSGRKVDLGITNEYQSPMKEQEGNKRRGRGKNNSEKDLNGELSIKEVVSSPKSTTKSLNKEERHLVENPGTKSKRKRTPRKKVSRTARNDKSTGENLVGSRVMVWWPKDSRFYEGDIGSFDPIKKRHKVTYFDGDVEILDLKKERWELVGGDRVADEGKLTDLLSPDASFEWHQKKKRRNLKPIQIP